MPWKNGGGVTQEIAAGEDACWRVSIARIDRDGPFSDFTGYDRTILPIEGNGVELCLDGKRTIALRDPHHPFSFAGEARVACRLIGGPVRDLNVMSLRHRFVHALAVRALRAGQAIEEPMPAPLSATFIVVLRGALASAHAGDALRVHAALALACAQDALLCTVRIAPTG